MAIFRRGDICVFSLSPHLSRHQKPYIFLLIHVQKEFLAKSIPVLSLCAILNILSMTVCYVWDVWGNKAHNQLAQMVFVAIAIFIFFSYFFMFVWIKIQ